MGKRQGVVKTSACPTVQLELDSRPECVALVRAMLVGVGELLEFGAELLADLKIAVSEACNNVVMHAYSDAPGPLNVTLTVEHDAVEVSVVDTGRGLGEPPHRRDRSGLGMAVIESLTSRSSFSSDTVGGTEVSMSFALRGDELSTGAGTDLLEAAPALRPEGEVVVTVAPVWLLAGILRRVAGCVAAEAHFSIDRYADLYLVTDGIASHASRHASAERISAGLAAHPRQIDLAVGPFQAGTATRLQAAGADCNPRLLALLIDEVEVDTMVDAETVQLMLLDVHEGVAASN